MRQALSIIISLLFFGLLSAQDNVLVIYATQGNLNEIIEADTLADGSQAHDIYRLVSLDTTYKFTGLTTISSDVIIEGVVDPTTNRPPCIQPAVLQDQSIPPTIFTFTGAGTNVVVRNLYLLAIATNNTANGGGIAIRVTADDVRLTVDNCVFDGWQTFGISYNGQWDDFFITNSHFRNFVHPNQWYIGEVLRNEWPGEAYTDTVSMVGNTMLCLNGYASAPVTKYYETYFEFNENKVLYTFKNPFFIFNVTKGKMNDNIFYANYSGGVDQTEHPWWDNLWYPDSSYGVIAFQPLDTAKAKIFSPDDTTNADYMPIIEAKREIEVKNNTYYWPTEITDFWNTWNTNNASGNWIRTPVFMNDRTVAMFNDDTAYPYLDESNNVNADPGFMSEMNDEILNGTADRWNIGFFDYFEQIRTGTAAADLWGYKLTNVGTDEDWVPVWPLPESQYITALGDEFNPSIPADFHLNRIYPNPFNPSTTVEYTLDQSGPTTLKVYNVLGQEVVTLLDNEYQTAKTYSKTINMKNQPSGTYFVHLRQGNKSAVKKMLLIK
ncbi:MAG TPA: T9SS type A sorting domain-containing protein [Caldithrix abyssi]|uniref:T9SS type A sorting domain-containing protein n=1 Tax=Caldithrix abyssi TaxID=187145 RepID=A0A7V4TXB0_CALAY|nr:T9SS type A sorting domain-containing protein [Caldithrix abyssi]